MGRILCWAYALMALTAGVLGMLDGPGTALGAPGMPDAVAAGVFLSGLVALPPLWSGDHALFDGLGLSGRQRAMAALAMILLAPLLAQPL